MIDVFVEPIEEISIEIENELIPVGDYEHYKGDYSVTPKFEKQKLNTKNLVMDNDMTIASIPITKVSNASGGNTVIIGG